ncbi:hypothetical protein [Nostoc sp. LPT]|uniref:hypothetical protein n=1 Tax=Nostoc sp. LPT TaxID=2815387 RepID=UPI001DE6333D|nr:hypothetical protein [Nostoc sp. LPT]MBN4005815.1 hypothetical protein [Nostoc sp. LPT]
MRLSLSDLCATFKECTLWTNNIIKDSLSSRLGILEESITDINLVTIARKHSDFILTKKFSRREEGSQSGADWLWCIGEPGAWLSLLVQAKVVNPITSTCRFLNYRSGEQRRLLLNFARHYRLFPLYCLYSQITDEFYPSSKLLPSLSNFDSSEWACSLVIPKFIRKLVEQKHKKQIDLLKYGIPWTYPFYMAATNSDQKLAHSLAEAMKKIRTEFESVDSSGMYVQLLDNSSSKAKKQGTTRIRWENPDPLLLVTPNLPSVALRLLKGKISAVKSPVAGLSIISTVPIDAVLQTYKALPTSDRESFHPSKIARDDSQVQLDMRVSDT